MASCVYSSQIVLSDSLLRLIHHYSKLELQRLGKDRNHGKGASANDLIDDLERVVRAEDLQVVVKDLTSRPSFYKRLQQSLVRYRWISAAGGWPQIPAGRSFRPSMHDSCVLIIREHLQAMGNFTGPSSDSTFYDLRSSTQGRSACVPEVPSSRGRRRRGSDDPSGHEIPVVKRVNQIRIKLERMRWISDGLPDDSLLVNIPEQRVKLFRGGQRIVHQAADTAQRGAKSPEGQKTTQPPVCKPTIMTCLTFPRLI